MSIKREWALMKARVDRLVALSSHARESNSHIAVEEEKAFEVATKDVGEAMERFVKRFANVLPIGALDCWERAKQLPGVRKEFRDLWPSPKLIILTSFVGQLDAMLEEPEREWVFGVERAFLHLQRTLEVDHSMRSRWADVFRNSREPDLERLGAVHLLAHGIFGFKADGSGGRTDLILGTSVVDRDAVRAGTPQVLTEWKKVPHGESASSLLEQAIGQMDRYQRGGIAGLELTTTCFAVLVSHSELDSPPHDSELKNGMSVRVINLAVAPTMPSDPSKPLS